MCASVVKKVVSVASGIAKMEDGRTVYLGDIDAVSVGDYLEIYADLALAKVSTPDAQSIYSARVGKGRRHS